MKKQQENWFYPLIFIVIVLIISTSCTKQEEVGLPVVTTVAISIIGQNEASCGGIIISSGGSVITERGVCWSSAATPAISDNRTMDGPGTGSYASTITGLNSGTLYNVRAYAANYTGTGYGSPVSFTTLPSTDTIETVTDIDGNVYLTVAIGTQTWMKENLKTTKYNDGTPIPLVTESTEWISSDEPEYCWYENNISYCMTYGALYNWNTVDAGNLCPSGWHVADDDEWTTLANYLGGLDVAGGKLKEAGYTHWEEPNTGATNETGFTALPGGYRRDVDGMFDKIREGSFWWTRTQRGSKAWSRRVNEDDERLEQRDEPHGKGFSVRCIKG